jgi:hypothetical protein
MSESWQVESVKLLSAVATMQRLKTRPGLEWGSVTFVFSAVYAKKSNIFIFKYVIITRLIKKPNMFQPTFAKEVRENLQVQNINVMRGLFNEEHILEPNEGERY